MASMLLDLYDEDTIPKRYSHTDTTDDDDVRNTQLMRQILRRCIQDYTGGSRTWGFPTFTLRLVKDSLQSWYGDPAFNQLRPSICDIFSEHHHSPADTGAGNYCKPWHGIDIMVDPVIPVQFNVSQNYPNPLNGATRIEFSIPQPGDCTADIYNILGQRVWTRTLPDMPTGNHYLDLGDKEIGDLASGIYFYRITSNDASIVKRMLILK